MNLMAWDSVNFSQVAANATVVVVALGGGYRIVSRLLDRKIDDRIQPKLEMIHDRIDTHMDEEESSRKEDKRFKKWVRKELREQRLLHQQSLARSDILDTRVLDALDLPSRSHDRPS